MRTTDSKSIIFKTASMCQTPMRVIDHLADAQRPLISFEISPPQRGGDITLLEDVIKRLARFQPPFIDVTSRASEAVYERTPEGIKFRTIRKRPGTIGICALIQRQYNIDAVPHVVCQGFTREETEDFLIELNYLKIQNVLALRGDELNYVKSIQEGKTTNAYAVDLVRQIEAMNRGEYTRASDAQPTSFCIGVAGYPERHAEAPNLRMDIERTKEKVDAGASYVVTQMCFDVDAYVKYVSLCREAGITVPIIPGMKVLTNAGQLRTIPRRFNATIPYELSEPICTAPDAAQAREMGIQGAVCEAERLLEAGAPSLHFYLYQDKDIGAVEEVMGRLKDKKIIH